MNFKYLIFLLFLITSCVAPVDYKKDLIITETKFSNKGFTLVYDKLQNEDNYVSKEIEERSLILFQKNLKKGSTVKITNLLNGQSVIAKVGNNAKYPNFYNSVISKRISVEIDLNLAEPYVEIISLGSNISFVAKKAKTFDEEKKVANKAPVEGISINDLNSTSLEMKNKKNSKDKLKRQFKYIIKIGDFYFIESAKTMKKRIIDELKMKNVKISKVSNNSFRVFAGPYENINDLKSAYNIVSELEFENIEIIKK